MSSNTSDSGGVLQTDGKMPFNKSNSSSEGAELKDVKGQKQKGNKNVQENKDDNGKKKCKNDPKHGEIEVGPVKKPKWSHRRVMLMVENLAKNRKLEKKIMLLLNHPSQLKVSSLLFLKVMFLQH